MSGITARTGFQYQDLYLLYRVLQNASDLLDHAWQGSVSDVRQFLSKNAVRYGIEASPRTVNQANGPDWDVLILAKDKFEFAEVKSGIVAKDDRIAFWRRLRRELAVTVHTGRRR